MTSIIRNKSKSRSKKTRESIMTDEKIDQIMKDITLKRPTSKNSVNPVRKNGKR